MFNIKDELQMKKVKNAIFLIGITVLSTLEVCAQLLPDEQADGFPGVDISPMDVSYFPANLPMNTTFKGSDESPILKIYYSRPSKKGREIFGSTVAFGKLWRLGANEATEIVLYRKVTVGTTSLPPGTYSLSAIPHKDKWTIIVNSKTAFWGNFGYDASYDVVRVDVPTRKSSASIETLGIYFKKVVNGALLKIGWDDTYVEIPLIFEQK
jgi:hypothetical protein